MMMIKTVAIVKFRTDSGCTAASSLVFNNKNSTNSATEDSQPWQSATVWRSWKISYNWSKSSPAACQCSRFCFRIMYLVESRCYTTLKCRQHAAARENPCNDKTFLIIFIFWKILFWWNILKSLLCSCWHFPYLDKISEEIINCYKGGGGHWTELGLKQ